MSEHDPGESLAFLHDSLENWKQLSGMFPDGDWQQSPESILTLLRHEPTTNTEWTLYRDSDGLLLKVDERRIEELDEAGAVSYSLESDGMHESFNDWEVFGEILDAAFYELLNGANLDDLSQEQKENLLDQAYSRSKERMLEVMELNEQFSSAKLEQEKQRLLIERLQRSQAGPIPTSS